jgi:hypothetical protein
MKDETALYYALSTIAQCAAALAALLGFFGLQALERLRHEEDHAARRLRALLLHAPAREAEDASSRAGLIHTVHYRVAHPESSAQLNTGVNIVLQTGVKDLETRIDKRQRLMDVLVIFLLGTLAVLVIAIGLIPFAEALYPWVWTMRVCIMGLSLWLGVAPAYVVFQAAGVVPMWQRAWSRVRHWHGPALVAARLRDRWRRQQRKSPP